MGNADSQEEARYREGLNARLKLAHAMAAAEAEGAEAEGTEAEGMEAGGNGEAGSPGAKRRRVGGGGGAVGGAVGGPRLLGKGKFGCVHSPPIVCPDGSLAEFAGDETKASKYAPTTEVARELAVYRSLDRMDPEFRFHLRVYGSCRASGEDPPGCFTDYLLLDWDRPRSIMVMDRGGPSLAALRSRKAAAPDNLDLARSYENLYRALQIMADRGLVYGDVAPENLVVGTDGLLRFIDFNRAEFTTPEQARHLLATDLSELQELAREDLEEFHERERTHPEEFAALRRFAEGEPSTGGETAAESAEGGRSDPAQSGAEQG